MEQPKILGRRVCGQTAGLISRRCIVARSWVCLTFPLHRHSGTTCRGTLRALMLATALVAAALGAAGGADAQAELSAGANAVIAGTDSEGVRLRDAPGLSAHPIGVLAEATRVQLLEGPRSTDGQQWWRVRAGDAVGWTAERYLRAYEDRLAMGPLNAVGASFGSAAGSALRMQMQITGYHFPAARNPRTQTGTVPRWGTVAVDPQVIPLGTRLAIEGFEGTVFVAEDTGSAVRGLIVDVWFDDLDSARRFGRQTRTVTVLGR